MERLSAADEKGGSIMLGADTCAVVAHIVATHPEIGHVYFGAPRVNPQLLDRVANKPSDRQFVEVALKRNRDLDLSTWFLALSASNIPQGVLDAAAFHQGISSSQFSVPADGLTADTVDELARRQPQDRIFSLCSLVQLRAGSKKHLPMIDFQCRKTATSLDLVRDVTIRVGGGAGFIVETARSYHFFGLEVFSEYELAQFLGRALLYAPIVDQAWITHQLIDMCCALRIVPRTPTLPAPAGSAASRQDTVVAVVESSRR